MFVPKSKFKIKIIDPMAFFNELTSLKFKVYSFVKVKDELYEFTINGYQSKKFIKLYPHAQLVKSEGFFFIFKNLLKNKTTLICIIICSGFYYQLSIRIWKINISGDSSSRLEDLIRSELNAQNILIQKKVPNFDNLTIIEKRILYNLKNSIEYLEIRNVGTTINVKYQKRRLSQEFPEKQSSIFAPKDAIIKSLDVESGVKMVKENDFVRKGDMLVSDTVINEYGESYFVGALAKVYAYTWYTTTNFKELEANVEYDESEVFINLLQQSYKTINYYIYEENEYIDNQHILFFTKTPTHAILKVHYTLVENLAK